MLPEGAGQRGHSLREVFNGLRSVVKAGAPWRWMPNDLPPWAAVYRQARRWLTAGCFEALAADPRAVLRLAHGRTEEPTAAVLDNRTLRSTPESGARAGWDGYKRTRGSKLHIQSALRPVPPGDRFAMAVDTLGHLLALHVTPTDENDRAAVAALAGAVQETTGQHVELAYVDQAGERAAEAAQAEGIRLEVVKLPEAKRGFVLLPRCLGGRALLRVDVPRPQTCTGLRAPAQRIGRIAHRRIRHADAPTSNKSRRSP